MQFNEIEKAWTSELVLVRMQYLFVSLMYILFIDSEMFPILLKLTWLHL